MTSSRVAELTAILRLIGFASAVIEATERCTRTALRNPSSNPMPKKTPNSAWPTQADSAMAATVMDLLAAVKPSAVLLLGKCGGLKKTKIGDFILPIAAIRGEGTSNDYFPPEVPALPAFALQKAISTTIREHEVDYWTGTVYTTNRRVWEHDEEFKNYLQKIRAYAIDMETATVFSVAFFNKIPTGALLLVSDQPMTPEGVKTEESDRKVTGDYVKTHLKIGIESLKQLINDGLTVRHLRF